MVDKWYHVVGLLLVLSRRKWCTWETLVGVYSLEMPLQWEPSDLLRSPR